MERTREGYGQIAEKPLHFQGAHLAWVAFSVKEDKTLNPLAVSGFGADRVVFESHHLADLLQQF
jgi:hypothetical protein